MPTNSDNRAAAPPTDVLTPAELGEVHEVWLQTGAVLDWARAFRKAFDPMAGKALKVAYFQWIDPDDLPAMKAWAEGMCRGCTLSQLAEDFGVEPDRTAVYAHFTRGFESPATRRVVREACEQELDKTESMTRSTSRPADIP
jgi:hypothetical protein